MIRITVHGVLIECDTPDEAFAVMDGIVARERASERKALPPKPAGAKPTRTPPPSREKPRAERAAPRARTVNGKPPKIGDDEARELFLRYRGGESIDALGREEGVTGPTIRNTFARLGLGQDGAKVTKLPPGESRYEDAKGGMVKRG